MKKPTIYQIKRLTEHQSPFFFSRSTMKFFKQTLAGFKVSRIDNNKFLISYEHGRLKSQRIFNATNNTLNHVGA